MLEGVELLGKIHERKAGWCPEQVDSRSACTQAAKYLLKIGGKSAILKVGDYALQLGATPLNETRVLVAWGWDNCAHTSDFDAQSF